MPVNSMLFKVIDKIQKDHPKSFQTKYQQFSRFVYFLKVLTFYSAAQFGRIKFFIRILCMEKKSTLAVKSWTKTDDYWMIVNLFCALWDLW